VAEPARPIAPRSKKPDKSLPTLVTELWELVVGYLKQETLEPLKGLARFVALGVLGAILIGIGFVVLSIALLRVFQVETGTHLTGNLSWVPYALTLAAVIGVAGLAASRIGAGRRKGGK
jgi:hypothetical protein